MAEIIDIIPRYGDENPEEKETKAQPTRVEVESEQKKKKDIYPEMRLLVFGLHREDGNPFEKNKINAMMFETNDGEKTFSVVVTADGNASMYFDNGTILSGFGKGDPNIRKTAAVVCAKAQEYLPELTKSKDMSQPAEMRRAIFIITDSGFYRTVTPVDGLDGLDEAQSFLTGLYAVVINTIHNSPLLKNRGQQ